MCTKRTGITLLHHSNLNTSDVKAKYVKTIASIIWFYKSSNNDTILLLNCPIDLEHFAYFGKLSQTLGPVLIMLFTPCIGTWQSSLFRVLYLWFDLWLINIPSNMSKEHGSVWFLNLYINIAVSFMYRVSKN